MIDPAWPLAIAGAFALGVATDLFQRRLRKRAYHRALKRDGEVRGLYVVGGSGGGVGLGMSESGRVVLTVTRNGRVATAHVEPEDARLLGERMARAGDELQSVMSALHDLNEHEA